MNSHDGNIDGAGVSAMSFGTNFTSKVLLVHLVLTREGFWKFMGRKRAFAPHEILCALSPQERPIQPNQWSHCVRHLSFDRNTPWICCDWPQTWNDVRICRGKYTAKIKVRHCCDIIFVHAFRAINNHTEPSNHLHCVVRRLLDGKRHGVAPKRRLTTQDT